jgi:hypothetical protein
MPLFGPLLLGLGVDVNKMNESLEKIDEHSITAVEMTSIPDRFSDIFAEHGFIMYDMMNFEAAKTAVERAESGEIQEALQGIIDYYNPENVRWLLGRMKTVKAFGPRLLLAYKALIDFEEERYHACVPVVLALMDGLVNDLHEDHKETWSQLISRSVEIQNDKREIENWKPRDSDILFQ